MSNLSKTVNIGKDTEAKLISVGIDSIEKLRAIGSEEAFIKLQTLDPGACICLLMGLEGAVQGIKSKDLSPGVKQALKEFHKMAQKNLKK